MRSDDEEDDEDYGEEGEEDEVSLSLLMPLRGEDGRVFSWCFGCTTPMRGCLFFPNAFLEKHT